MLNIHFNIVKCKAILCFFPDKGINGERKLFVFPPRLCQKKQRIFISFPIPQRSWRSRKPQER